MNPDPDAVNILIVDDDARNLTAMVSILESLGENVIIANSGEAALKFLLDHDFAVILLDVQMPFMDGFETAKLIRAREKFQDTPIIFVTAYSKDDKDVYQGYALGAVDYIFKPVNADALKAKVVVFVDLYKKSEALKARVRREIESLEKFAKPANTSVTAGSFGSGPLSETFSESFDDFARQFSDLMEKSIERRAFKVEHNVTDGLKKIADQLGFLKSGPRDVVEIYQAVLRRKTDAVAAKRVQIYQEEGLVLVVELMGNLVAYYRSRAIGEPVGDLRMSIGKGGTK